MQYRRDCLLPLRRLRLLSAYCRRKHGPLRQMQAQRYISPAMDMSITSIATVRHLLDPSQQASRSGTVAQGMYVNSVKRGTRNLAAAASRTEARSRTQDGSLRTADGGTGMRMDHILQIAGRRSMVPGISSSRRAGCRQASLLTPGDNRHQAPGDSVHFQPDDIGQCAGIRKC